MIYVLCRANGFEEKENLENMILVQKMSYEDIGRHYGCSGSNIKKVAIRIGLREENQKKVKLSIRELDRSITV